MAVLALWFWEKTKAWLAGVGMALIIIGVAFWKGRASGEAAVKAADAKAQAKAIENKRESDNAVDQMDPGGVDAELGKWMRDKR